MTNEILLNNQHVYSVDGNVVAGVTDCLRDLKGLENVPEKTLERPREIGRYADEAIMLYIDDNLKEETLSPALVPYLRAWQRAVEHYGIVVVCYQQRVYHKTYRYAGTLDLVIDITKNRPPHLRGRGLVVTDLKCTYDVGPEVGLQLVAYQEAYNNQAGFLLDAKSVRHRLALQLFDTQDFKPHWFTERSDFMTFVGCLYRHNWRLKHGYEKRRNET